MDTVEHQTPTELAAAQLYSQRVELLSGAMKLWAADDEHPSRLHGLRAVVGADIRDVFEFIAELMAAQVFPVAPDIRRYAFIVGAVNGLSYSDMAKALDCSTGYISRTMRDTLGGGSKSDVIETYKPKLQKAVSLFATVNNSMQVTPEQAVQATTASTMVGGVVLTPELPEGAARDMSTVSGPTNKPQPRLQEQEDM